MGNSRSVLLSVGLFRWCRPPRIIRHILACFPLSPPRSLKQLLDLPTKYNRVDSKPLEHFVLEGCGIIDDKNVASADNVPEAQATSRMI